MQAIESMLERVMSRIASGAPAELSEKLTVQEMSTDPREAPEVLAETITTSSKAPEVLPERITRSSEAPEVLPERITRSSEAPEVLPERITRSSEAPEMLPERITTSSKAPEVLPERITGYSKVPMDLSDRTRGSSIARTQAPATAGPSLKASGNVFEPAYLSLLPAMLALPPSKVVSLNISAPHAVTKALGIQPTLAEMKGRISKSLEDVDERLPEHLVTHAHALFHAHSLFLMASRDADALPSLRAEGKKLRTVLLTDADGLIQRGRVDAMRLHGLKNDASYRHLAFDLHILAQLFQGLPDSSGPTTVSAKEIQRAEELAATILNLVGRRKDLRASVEKAADLRNRAFTLFARVYDETRRVVVYLRWHNGDADELVPSLYARRKDRKKTETVDTTPGVPPDPATTQ
jgi:hypothetical protein